VIVLCRLSDSSDNAILKMADFGLSAVMFAAGDDSVVGGSFDAGQRSASDENKANSPLFGDSSTKSPALLGHHMGMVSQQPHCDKSVYNKSLQESHLAEGSPVKRLRSVVGSPHYVPPEVTAGRFCSDMIWHGVVMEGYV
jgi:serine/threonine protein kinase